MINERTKALLFFAAGVLCLALAGLLIATFKGRWEAGSPTVVAGALPVTSPAIKESADALPQNSEWVVYITGHVQRPGVYHVLPASRVYHAIDMAGGLASSADPEAVNLATPLEDGMHIHVPGKGEGAMQKPASPSSGQNSDSSAVKKVNINRASEEELQALPGVGPSTAGSIVHYRESQGLFNGIEDLLRVRGIGPAKFEKIRHMVTVNQ